MKEVTKRIKQLRAEKGWDQAALADQMGIARATVCGWENEYREPNKESCEALCKIFNVDMGYLLGQTKIRNVLKKGIDIVTYDSKDKEIGTVVVPEMLLDPEMYYWGEINEGETQIAIFCRQTKNLVCTITKF